MENVEKNFPERKKINLFSVFLKDSEKQLGMSFPVLHYSIHHQWQNERKMEPEQEVSKKKSD